MARMRVYTVHVLPSKPYPYETAEFVCEGFNWRAFFFTGAWALVNRLWWQAVVLFAFNSLILAAWRGGWFSHAGVAAVYLGLHWLVGGEANDWLRARLRGRGYVMTDLTGGDSELMAELRYFDRHLPDAHAA